VTTVVSRFAPAPTGFLHLGHVVNALFVWGLTRAAGGRVWLRIEDHDRQRSRREYETAILEDLTWLGFAPDQPPLEAWSESACDWRQSDRVVHYEAALDILRQQGLIYACGCSRRALAAEVPARSGEGREVRYPGACANRQLAEGAGLGLRVRLAPSVERFDDLAHGWQEQRPSEQCGDLLVKDRDGNWTYQFVAAVDDYLQRVTLVIRGDDLLASTGRQMQLARLLGRAEPPWFFHHGLVMKSPVQKLSKSDGDTGVRDLRRAGQSADAVIGRALQMAGLSGDDRPRPAGEASALVAERYRRAVERLR
jgi:glutamyl-Q tRNA(Asp) synthetase